MPAFPLLYLDRGGALAAAVVCVALAVSLWREGELYGLTFAVVISWFVLALAIEVWAAIDTRVGLWIVGLLSQIGLAIFLSLKRLLTRW